MIIMKKLVSLFHRKKLPHTRLPAEFMTPKEEPKLFVGREYRVSGRPGFTDDRRRNAHGFVPYAPRRIVPDMLGGGVAVHEEYPQSQAHKIFPDITEANTPRQTRGQKYDTLTQIHDEQTEFDVAVAAFKDTLDEQEDAWNGKKNPTTKQPPNPFNTRYPYSHVRLTESGHLFEADDTPGSERIKESHRVGTYYEIGPDGSRVTKIVRDDFTVIVGNERVNIKGGAIVTIEGDCNLYTKGNFTHQVDGDYNLLVKGKMNQRVADTVMMDYHSDCFLYVGRPVDPAKGSGRGNLGGDLKIEITNDYMIETGGSATEIFGDATRYDEDGTTVNHNSVVFGNRKEMVVGGLKYHQIEQTLTEVVGQDKTTHVNGNMTDIVTGNKFLTVAGNVTDVISGTDTITIGGAYLLTACSTYAIVSSGLATYTAVGGITQTVTGTLTITSGITTMTSTGITTIVGSQIQLNP